MAKNTKKRKGSKVELPQVEKESLSKESQTLPYNGTVVKESGLSLSFASFDRSHELFNMSGPTVSVPWLYDFLNALKEFSSKTITELIHSNLEFHPVNWGHANASLPRGFEQLEYWQFRISKSKGRVIGIKIDQVFYVVWIDAEHNLCDSEGYGTARKYSYKKSDYEILTDKIKSLEERLKAAEEERDEYRDIVDSMTQPDDL